jgi:hypothetical protein
MREGARRPGCIGWLAALHTGKDTTLGWLLLLNEPIYAIQMRIDIIPYVSVYFNRREIDSNTSFCFRKLHRY